MSTKRQMARLADALDAAERAKGVYKAALREMSEERERLMSEAAAAETELLLLRRAVAGLTTQRDRLLRRVSETEGSAGDGGTTQGAFPTGAAGLRAEGNYAEND